jgi:hypothetical protein
VVEDAGGSAVASLAEDPLYRMGVRQPPVCTILVCDRAAVANSWMESPVKSWAVAGGADIAGLEDHACMRAVAVAVVVLVHVDARAAEVVGAVEVEVLGVVRGALFRSARGGLLAVCLAVLAGLDYKGWVVGASLGVVVEGGSVHLGLALPAEGRRPWAGEEAASDRLDAAFALIALIAPVEGKAVPCLEAEGERVAALATAPTVVGPVGAVGVRRPEALWRRCLAR